MTENKYPLISIIIPVYNVEKYLEDCLNSVIQQSYKNLEIIIVNDGSTDSSLKICEQFRQKDKRIIIVNQKNLGLSEARNKGISVANGEYITFADSDDSIDSRHIKYLFKLITKYNADISIAAQKIITKNKTIDLGKKQNEQQLSQKSCLKKMLNEDGFTVSANSKLYKKELFDSITYPKGKAFEDNGTTYKLILKSKVIAYGPKSYYNYRLREGSITLSKFSEKNLDLLRLTEQMRTEINSVYPSLSDFTQKRLIHSQFSILRQMINVNLSEKMKQKKKELIKDIKSNSKTILTKKCYNKTDRIALLSLKMGWPIFSIAWKIYESTK